MSGTIEVAHRRSGTRGSAAVDRVEKFLAEYVVKDGAMNLVWRGSNGQRNDLQFQLPPELNKEPEMQRREEDPSEKP
jgi:hypothetical protein